MKSSIKRDDSFPALLEHVDFPGLIILIFSEDYPGVVVSNGSCGIMKVGDIEKRISWGDYVPYRGSITLEDI